MKPMTAGWMESVIFIRLGMGALIGVTIVLTWQWSSYEVSFILFRLKSGHLGLLIRETVRRISHSLNRSYIIGFNPWRPHFAFTCTSRFIALHSIALHKYCLLYKFWRLDLHQQKDYNLLKAQSIAFIF